MLVVERAEEGKAFGVQRPIYYLSKVLSACKQRYPHYRKLVYGVFLTARKLKHYYQEHTITVLTDAPLSDILNNPDATGRVAKWGIELGPRDIIYQKRNSLKSQVVADFCAEWIELQTPTLPDLSSSWTMYFDGSKRNEGAGAGVVLTSLKGDKLRYILQINFPKASNNDAEYEALLHGMRMAKACGATRLMIYGDSNLVVQQTMKECDAISENMIAYRNMYNSLEGSFDGCELCHVGRASNEEADKLANIGSTRAPIPPGVFLESIDQRSIKVKKLVDSDTTTTLPEATTTDFEAPATADDTMPEQVMLVEPTWTQPFLSYMLRKELPEDKMEARQIVRRSKAYTIINGELYKRSISGVFQRCIAPEDGLSILLDIHTGLCGHHASSRLLVSKAFRAGFYWLTASQDAKDIVRKCEACQKFATRPQVPATELNMIPLAWPFAQWGLDMVGPLKRSSHGGHTKLLVAVDKFTKWIEAVPVTATDATSVLSFIKSIVHRFGVPHSIITNNGTNFTTYEFQEFCEEQGIRVSYASVAHPQSNGQVEKANGLVTAGVKKRLLTPLKRAAGTWVEELPSVIWSLRTTPNRSTQYTPFFMVYGAEAVLPSDVRYNTPQVAAYTEEDSNAAIEDDVDPLDEARDIALARSAVYQQGLRNYHSRRVRSRSFAEGDLVLRLKQKSHHKLSPPWEEPYIITEVIRGGAYRLKDANTGVVYSNPWNVAQLHRFYA